MSKSQDLKQTYDAWGTDYDTYLPYEEKFVAEADYYGQIFAKHGVKRVLDAGCGTGRHSVLLARRGFQVTGSDLSDGMLEQARSGAKRAGIEMPFIQAAFQELSSRVSGTFDGVLCTGSGLAHLISEDDLRQGLAELARVLRPGGVLVADNMNFALVDEEPFAVGPLQSFGTGADEKLWLRALRYEPPVVHYTAISMYRQGNEWQMEEKHFPLLADTPGWMMRMLPELGFEVVSHDPHCDYGGSKNPYLQKHKEPKSVLVARRL